MKPYRPGRSFKYYKVFKPYGMLSQFSDREGRPVLKDLGNFSRDVYPVGRLDMDSEGLLLLTDDPRVPDALLNPENRHKRTYLVLVERIPDQEALNKLEQGIEIEGVLTLQATARLTGPPLLPERVPPVRVRKTVPDAWISLTLIEGRNRQVRKMTAAVGHPTLRLVRTDISGITLGSLQPGDTAELTPEERTLLFSLCNITTG